MKNIYKQIGLQKIPAAGINFWLHLLNWLQLLILSLTRTKEKLPDKVFHFSKTDIMKTFSKFYITHFLKQRT